MLLVWYPYPLFAAVGGQQVLMILLGVDVTLGPLITLTIFNPKKSRRALSFDLTIIALLQITALIYGMSVVFQARPAYVVFNKDSFNLITANMLSDGDIAKAEHPGYRSLPLTGPLYVYSREPTDIKEINEALLGELNGKGLSQLPQFYMPYNDHMADASKAAKPVTELKKLNPDRTADIDNSIRASGRAESDVGFLPLRAKYQDQVVLVGKSDGRVLALLPLNPLPPAASVNRDKK